MLGLFKEDEIVPLNLLVLVKNAKKWRKILEGTNITDCDRLYSITKFMSSVCDNFASRTKFKKVINRFCIT